MTRASAKPQSEIDCRDQRPETGGHKAWATVGHVL